MRKGRLDDLLHGADFLLVAVRGDLEDGPLGIVDEGVHILLVGEGALGDGV